MLDARPYRLMLTADAVGGVWRYALDLARELARSGVEVAVATLGPEVSPEQKREAEGVAGLELIETGHEPDWLCERPEQAARAAAVLADCAQSWGADLVQLNGANLGGLARFEAPVVAVHHSCLTTWWNAVKREPAPLDWAWRHETTLRHLKTVDGVAAPTRAFAAATASAYRLDRVPRFIPNGRPQPVASAPEQPAAVVFTAGRLWDEGKDVGCLDRAARDIPAPVLAAGPTDGPNGAAIRLTHIQTLGALSEKEMRARLAEQPIFVSAALYEPFGLAVLEAAQAGCALILSDIPTFRELWGDAALFVNPRDSRALSETARRLLADPGCRSTLSAAARTRARVFSIERCAEATQAWHREVLRRSPSSVSAA